MNWPMFFTILAAGVGFVVYVAGGSALCSYVNRRFGNGPAHAAMGLWIALFAAVTAGLLL